MLSMMQLMQLKKNIVAQMYQRMYENHHVPEEVESMMKELPNTQQLDRLLAFRGDPWLYEFRTALKRMEEGTYGTCMLCKDDISLEKLQLDPLIRICDKCVDRLRLGKFNFRFEK